MQEKKTYRELPTHGKLDTILLYKTRPHDTHTRTNKNPEKEIKEKPSLLCRPGRPARSGRIVAKWRTLRLVRPAPLSARPFSSVSRRLFCEATRGALSRHVLSASCPDPTLLRCPHPAPHPFSKTSCSPTSCFFTRRSILEAP